MWRLEIFPSVGGPLKGVNISSLDKRFSFSCFRFYDASLRYAKAIAFKSAETMFTSFGNKILLRSVVVDRMAKVSTVI